MPPLVRLIALMMLLVGIGTSAVFFTAFSQKSEGQDRLIEMKAFPNAPVKIVIVKTKTSEVKLGKSFKDDDDWFKHLTFKVENVSNKPINYISAVMLFPNPSEREAVNAPYGERIMYGGSPLDIANAALKKRPPSIQPGESIELSLNDKSYEASRIMLNNLAYPTSINRIELSIQEVGFEDGTVWSGGELWRLDPDGSGRAIRVQLETTKNLPRGPSPPFPMINEASKSFVQNVLWIKPLQVPTAADCRRTGPEISESCNPPDNTCAVRTRFAEFEPSAL